LKEIRQVLGDYSQKYVTKLKLEYLIEVRNTNTKRVPNSWISQGGTKTLKRFHTPFVKEKLKVLSQNREQLEIEAKSAWTIFIE